MIIARHVVVVFGESSAFERSNGTIDHVTVHCTGRFPNDGAALSWARVLPQEFSFRVLPVEVSTMEAPLIAEKTAEPTEANT